MAVSYSSEVLADSPVLYYRLNEASGTAVEDFSGSNRDAAYVNSPTLGVSGALADGDLAATFNGTSQYVTVASASAGDTALKAMSGSFSLECWVKPTSLSGNRGLFDRYAGGGGTTSVFLFYLVGATPTFIVRNASNSDSTKSAASGISTGVWTHLVATYDGSTARIYINGTESGTGLSTTFSSHNRTPILEIGKFVFSNTYFAGTLDEVAVYPSALSSTRVADHYNAASSSGESGSFAVNLPVPVADFAGTYTPPTQTGSFALDLPVPVASFAGSYVAPIPGSFAVDLPVPVVEFAGTYDGNHEGALAVTLPTPVVEFAGSYVPAPISGSFAIDLPTPVVEFAGLASSGIGSFAVDLPLPTVEFTGSYGGPYPTDTSNDLGGISLEGSGVATVTRPVAAPPASLVLAHRVDKAAAYPTPTMVNGRPT